MSGEASGPTAAVRGDVDGVEDRPYAGGEAAPVAAVMETAGEDEEDVAGGEGGALRGQGLEEVLVLDLGWVAGRRGEAGFEDLGVAVYEDAAAGYWFAGVFYGWCCG